MNLLSLKQRKNRTSLVTQHIETLVKAQIERMQQQGTPPDAVLVGHEDWLIFSSQSEVSYTPFGSARRYQPALGGLQLIRVDEMHCLKVITQAEMAEYSQKMQFI